MLKHISPEYKYYGLSMLLALLILLPQIALADAPPRSFITKKTSRQLKQEKRKQRRKARRIRRTQRLINSRLGRWLMKRSLKKLHKRFLRKQKVKPHKSKTKFGRFLIRSAEFLGTLGALFIFIAFNGLAWWFGIPQITAFWGVLTLALGIISLGLALVSLILGAIFGGFSKN